MEGFDSAVGEINGPINSLVWGWPTVSLIAITGVVLMLGLRFMPIQRLPYGVRMMLEPSRPTRAAPDVKNSLSFARATLSLQ